MAIAVFREHRRGVCEPRQAPRGRAKKSRFCRDARVVDHCTLHQKIERADSRRVRLARFRPPPDRPRTEADRATVTAFAALLDRLIALSAASVPKEKASG
jgi:hypothetical protein